MLHSTFSEKLETKGTWRREATNVGKYSALGNKPIVGFSKKVPLCIIARNWIIKKHMLNSC
jgi:hypothetical protein